MRPLIAIAISLASFSAFAQSEPPEMQEVLLQKAFEVRLKDADSAKFRGIRYLPAGVGSMWRICGEFNAKNSYGGYAGYELFNGAVALDKDGKTVYLVTATGETAVTMCKIDGFH